MLNTYIALEAQRISVLKDLDKIENLKKSAVKRPYKFIKQVVHQKSYLNCGFYQSLFKFFISHQIVHFIFSFWTPVHES